MSLSVCGASKLGHGSEDDAAVTRGYVRQGNINLPEVIRDGSVFTVSLFIEFIYVIICIYTSVRT